MINIDVIRDKSRAIIGFEIKGHACFDISGKDIVCAAVSAIAYTALGGLKNVAEIEFHYTEQEGKFECCLISTDDFEKKNKASVIMETTFIGFKQIEKAYSKNVRVVDKEVQ